MKMASQKFSVHQSATDLSVHIIENRGLDSFKLRNATPVFSCSNMTFLLSLVQTVLAGYMICRYLVSCTL